MNGCVCVPRRESYANDDAMAECAIHRRARPMSVATENSQTNAPVAHDVDATTDAMSKLRVVADVAKGTAAENENSLQRRRGRVILCPVVDDEHSTNAVDWAVEHVYRDRNDTIHLLYICPDFTANVGYMYPVRTAVARAAYPMAFPTSALTSQQLMGAPTQDYYDQLHAETQERKRLERVKAKHWIAARFGRKLARLGVPFLIDLTSGARGNIAIGELLCAVAAAVHADMIVMSTHNRNAVARFFVGSVANYCLRNATVPVVMIRPGEYSSHASSARRVRVQSDEDDADDRGIGVL